MDRSVLAVPGGTVLGAVLWHLKDLVTRPAVPIPPPASEDPLRYFDRSWCVQEATCLEALVTHCVPLGGRLDQTSFLAGLTVGALCAFGYISLRHAFVGLARVLALAEDASGDHTRRHDGAAPRRPAGLPPVKA